MTSTIIHVALLIWSGLFIIAGAMLMIASQVGHLAAAVEAANRAADVAKGGTARGQHSGPAGTEVRTLEVGSGSLILPMPRRSRSRGHADTRHAL